MTEISQDLDKKLKLTAELHEQIHKKTVLVSRLQYLSLFIFVLPTLLVFLETLPDFSVWYPVWALAWGGLLLQRNSEKQNLKTLELLHKLHT